MNSESPAMSATSAGFAISAAITVLFSTALAWGKDAYKPLNTIMNAIAYHNWITHGLADIILFSVLGLIFSRTDFAARIAPSKLISFLIVAVVIAGVGLFAWYAVY